MAWQGSRGQTNSALSPGIFEEMQAVWTYDVRRAEYRDGVNAAPVRVPTSAGLVFTVEEMKSYRKKALV